MKATLLLTLLASILLLSSGCKKDDDTFTTVETVDASGNYAVDGCGFMLQIGDTYHKPTNENDISSSYKEDSRTEVEATIINYHKIKRYCQTNSELNIIKIVEIRRR